MLGRGSIQELVSKTFDGSNITIKLSVLILLLVGVFQGGMHFNERLDGTSKVSSIPATIEARLQRLEQRMTQVEGSIIGLQTSVNNQSEDTREIRREVSGTKELLVSLIREIQFAAGMRRDKE